MDSTLAIRTPVMTLGIPPAGQVYQVVPETTLSRVVVAASIGLSTYHGYRRNDSLGWALVWGALGALFPVVTPAVAFAQGFGKREGAVSRR